MPTTYAKTLGAGGFEEASDIIVLSVLTLWRVAVSDRLNGKPILSGQVRTQHGSAVARVRYQVLQQASSSLVIPMEGEPSTQGGHYRFLQAACYYEGSPVASISIADPFLFRLGSPTYQLVYELQT